MPLSTALKSWKSSNVLPTPASETRVISRSKAGHVAPSTRPLSMGSATDPNQIVLRRVQAVVNFHVKEESVDREVSSPKASTSAPVPATTTVQATKKNQAASLRGRKSKRPYVEIDDPCPIGSNHESGPSEPGNGARSTVRYEEEDELMMGAEVSFVHIDLSSG